jgi:hypothetical protein
VQRREARGHTTQHGELAQLRNILARFPRPIPRTIRALFTLPRCAAMPPGKC